jgi:hypothetical protein
VYVGSCYAKLVQGMSGYVKLFKVRQGNFRLDMFRPR